jgi:hypothetical protein
LLGFYEKNNKNIVVNKEAIKKSLRGEFSVRDVSKENPDLIVIYGQENSEELIDLIMKNEPEHRTAICLLIQVTMNTLNNLTVKDTFLKLQKANLPLYKELKKVGVLKAVGIKNKWKFW